MDKKKYIEEANKMLEKSIYSVFKISCWCSVSYERR